MKPLTQERLIELFEYSNGQLLWKLQRGSKKPGQRAGTLDISGYRVVGIDKDIYLEHRVIWLLVNGWMPANIDHRNRIKSDNNIENLRPATDSNNNCNRRMHKNNASGFKGVFFDKYRNKWGAAIKVNGKNLKIGRFGTPEAAHEAYKIKAIQLHGEFANY